MKINEFLPDQNLILKEEKNGIYYYIDKLFGSEIYFEDLTEEFLNSKFDNIMDLKDLKLNCYIVHAKEDFPILPIGKNFILTKSIGSNYNFLIILNFEEESVYTLLFNKDSKEYVSHDKIYFNTKKEFSEFENCTKTFLNFSIKNKKNNLRMNLLMDNEINYTFYLNELMDELNIFEIKEK